MAWKIIPMQTLQNSMRWWGKTLKTIDPKYQMDASDFASACFWGRLNRRKRMLLPSTFEKLGM
jgi:hypothetical protein